MQLIEDADGCSAGLQRLRVKVRQRCLQEGNQLLHTLGVLLCMFWQFGARLARVQNAAQWSQQQQQQQHGSSLLPQSVFKRVSGPHSSFYVLWFSL